MRIKQIALIVLLTLILLPVQSAFASRLAARTSNMRPFNSLQAATPTVVPPTSTPATVTREAPPLSLTLMLGFTCLALLLVIGVLVVGFIASVTNSKELEKQAKKK